MVDFFDKVKSGLDKGLNKVSIKSKEIIEVTRINNQIGALEEQITKNRLELGEAVYEMFANARDIQKIFDERAINERCEMITRLKEQIEEKEVELQNVHLTAAEAMGKALCRSCKTEVPEGAKFCNKCGNKISGS